MKKLILAQLFLCAFLSALSQSDTIFTKTQGKIPYKIPCKIIEISETDFKYKQANYPDGPIYVINRITVTKYTLANGFTEIIVPDELSLENEHGEIIGNRQVVKVHPFSVINNQISIAFEKVIKVGTNLDIEAGYVNSGLNPNVSNTPSSYFSGAYIKPGVKFFLGQDFNVKGLKYAHPLKGRYVRLDVALSYITYNQVKRYDYVSSTNGVPGYNRVLTTDINSFAYGGLINYGRQFILGNVLTMEYYFGIGFAGRTLSYSNAAYTGNGYSSYVERNMIANYHAFMRIPTLALSGAFGFRIGYIIPEKKSKRMTSTRTNN